MLTDEELIQLKNTWEILSKFQQETSSNMKTLNDESLGWHLQKKKVNFAYNAEKSLVKFIYLFDEK